MPNKPRAILHVGTEKAGSTAIQNAFNNSRAGLEQAGWRVPACLGEMPHVQLTATAAEFRPKHPLLRLVGLRSAEEQRNLSRALSDGLAKEIDKHNPETVFISDEHINVHLSSLEELQRLRNMLEEHVLIDEILIFLRRQDIFLAALVSEATKLGRFGLFDPRKPRTVDKVPPYRFSYRRIIENLGSAFAGSRIIVKRYRESQGYSTVAQLRSLYTELNSHLREPDSRSNASLSKEVLLPLLLIGNKASETANRAVLDRWVEVIAAAQKAFPGSPWRMPKELARPFLEEFREENEWICARYEQFENWLNPTDSYDGAANFPSTTELKRLIDAFSNTLDYSLLEQLSRIVDSVGDDLIESQESASPRAEIFHSQTSRYPLSLQPVDIQSEHEASQRSLAKCPVCAERYLILLTVPAREGPLCPNCRVSGRGSAVIFHLLRLAKGTTDLAISELDKDRELRVVGLSDSMRYGSWIKRKFNYRNTFFHKRPRLDIRSPNKKWLGWADVLISADVFEHVVGDSQVAFKGAYSVLKPGGALILTVPFVNIGGDKEHYSGLVDYRTISVEGEVKVELEFDDGTRRYAEKPIFHGGPGSTLEVRLFNRDRLMRELESAGFIDIEVYDENIPEAGIVWGPASRPVTARKPESA